MTATTLQQTEKLSQPPESLITGHRKRQRKKPKKYMSKAVSGDSTWVTMRETKSNALFKAHRYIVDQRGDEDMLN